MADDTVGPRTPVFTPASPAETRAMPPTAAHCRPLPPAQERGDGLERRPLVGIARERETSADDAAFRQQGIVRRYTDPGVLVAAMPAEHIRR